jgi:hypothetical protein
VHPRLFITCAYNYILWAKYPFFTNKLEKKMEYKMTQAEWCFVSSMARKSNGFSRGVSKYRGVARYVATSPFAFWLTHHEMKRF